MPLVVGQVEHEQEHHDEQHVDVFVEVRARTRHVPCECPTVQYCLDHQRPLCVEEC